MSKTASRQRKKGGGSTRTQARARDRTIYLGLLIIGAAIVAAAFLLDTERVGFARYATLAYLAAMAWLTNLYAIRALRGRPLARWQQALARLPLRCVGYGSRGGKPLEAAHDSPAAKKMIGLSILCSVVLLALLAVALLPDLQFWR